jgi:S-DNA-T family DNA segregation ATPase FtsK/SpoIIIE
VTSLARAAVGETPAAPETTTLVDILSGQIVLVLVLIVVALIALAVLTEVSGGVKNGLVRNRVVGPPVMTAAGTLATTFLLYLADLDINSLAAILAAAYALWWLLARFRSPDEWRRRFDYAVGLLAGIWIIQCHLRGWEAWRNLLTQFVVMTLACSALWVANTRVRQQAKIERKILNWPEICNDRRKLQNTYISDWETDGDVEAFHLNWPSGMFEVDEIINMVRKIEGMWGKPVGSMFIEPLYNPAGQQFSDRVLCKCVLRDMHAQSVRWVGPRAHSIMDTIDLGPYSDGQRETFTWWTEGVGGFHCLIAGLTRSGKSGLINLLIGSYAKANDCIFWLADFKGGDTMLPWAPMADSVAIDVEGGRAMLADLETILRRRAKLKSERRWKVWRPSRKDPVILFFCDEVAELTGRSGKGADMARIESIGRMGAGLGVLMVLATQYPTVGGAIGSSQIKTQLGWRACFRLQANDQMPYILPNAPKGVDPSRIPDTRKGTCYVDSNGRFRPTPLRVPLVSENVLDQVVLENWELTPELGHDYDEELSQDYHNRIIWTPDMFREMQEDGVTLEDMAERFVARARQDAKTEQVSDKEDEGVDWVPDEAADIKIADMVRTAPLSPHEQEERAAILAASPFQDNEEDPNSIEARQARLTKTLDEAPPDGLSPAEIIAKVKAPERWIHRELRRRRDLGTVDYIAKGKYRAPQRASAVRD